MSVREHDLNCFCGQPLDTTVAAASVHCTRCGLTTARSRLAYDARPLGVTATLVSAAAVAHWG